MNKPQTGTGHLWFCLLPCLQRAQIVLWVFNSFQLVICVLLQSNLVKLIPYFLINTFIIRKWIPLDFRFLSVFLQFVMSWVNSHVEEVLKFLPAQFSWYKYLLSNFIHPKFFLTEYWEVVPKNVLLIMHAGVQIWIWCWLRQRLTVSFFK